MPSLLPLVGTVTCFLAHTTRTVSACLQISIVCYVRLYRLTFYNVHCVRDRRSMFTLNRT